MIATRGVPRAVLVGSIACLIVIIVGIAVVIGLLLWPRGNATADRPAQPPRASIQPAGQPAGRAAPTLAAAVAPELAIPPELPGSLAGTEPDGELTADDAGRLVVDRELRRLFDYFLAASGEEPVAVMRARIVAVLHQRLPATAAAEAVAILDRYLAYRDAARTLAGPGAAATAHELLAQVRELRARWLTPAVARAFFGDDEAATAAGLARRDVAADTAMPAAERERRLAEIDASTPVAERQARAAALAPSNQLARETALRAAGASDDQIAAVRTAALGPEAAARLAALDRAHAAWDARLARFRAERAALLADRSLDDAERRRRIDELARRQFTDAERLRVEALDRIAAQAAAATASSTITR